MTTHATAKIDEHELTCMEIWSGHRAVESKAVSRGLEAWIYSNPYQGHSAGGDVHYLSLCVGGIVTRLVLADVAGHGREAAGTSTMLKSLMRRHMNAKPQDRLVAEINREFTLSPNQGRFATAVVMTYLSHKRQLLITNAGHPRPLFYSSHAAQWSLVTTDDSRCGVLSHAVPSDLPFGIDGATRYSVTTRSIIDGDVLVLYTDAITEATDEEGVYFGEQGLLATMNNIGTGLACDQIGSQVLSAVRSFSGHARQDDESIIVIRFGGGKNSPGLLEKLQGYAALLSGS